MNKLIVSVVVMIVALLLALLVYFKPWGGSSNNQNSFSAIPKTLPLIVSSNGVYQFIDKIEALEIPESVKNSTWFTEIKRNTTFLQNFSLVIDSSKQVLPIDNVVFGFSNIGGGNIGILNVIAFGSKIKHKDVEGFIEKLKVKNINVSNYNFKNNTVYTIEKLDGESDFSFSIHKKILIGSFQSSLVEESLQALNDNSGAINDIQFNTLLSKHNFQGDLNVFYNLASTNIISPLIFSNQYIPSANSMKNLGAWSALEVNFTKELILLTGYTNFSNEKKSMLSKLSQSIPVEITLTEILPNNTAYFNFVASDKANFFETDIDSISYLLSWVDNQYAHFSLESFDASFSKRAGVIVKAKDITLAKDNLFEVSKSNQSTEAFLDFEIFNFENGDLLNESFPQGLIKFEKSYFSFIENYVIFTEDVASLKAIIQKYKEGNVLSRDLTYLDFSAKSSTKSNYFVYCNPSLWSMPLLSMFRENSVSPNFINNFSLQFSNINNAFYTAAKIEYGKKIVAKSNKLWDIQLDTTAFFQPQVVINHENNSKEVMTQDAMGNLYLINTSGEIVFKLALDGAIMSEIFQIDFYNNKKLQYVFNTASKIYVIDRMGESVGDYPINLPASATNGMTVVNYDKSNNYRFFVACENGNIYGYEFSGKPLPGWSPLSDVGIVKFPLQHNVLLSNDFLTFFNTEGLFFAVNRKAEPRFKPVSTNSNKFHQNFDLQNEDFVNGASGSLYKISKTGALSIIPLADSIQVHYKLVKLKLQDSYAHAFAGDKSFVLTKTQIEKVASYNTDDAIIELNAHVLSNQLWFTVRTSSKVYLISETGGIHPDFPINTNSSVAFSKLYEGKDDVLLLHNEEGKLQVIEIKFAN
jgi:hypothetical protein